MPIRKSPFGVSTLISKLNSDCASVILALSKAQSNSYTEDGGAILAFALAKVLFSKVFVLFDPESGNAYRFYVKTHIGTYLDARGNHHNPLDDFHRDFPWSKKKLKLVPYCKSMTSLDVIDMDASGRLAEFIAPNFSSESFD